MSDENKTPEEELPGSDAEAPAGDETPPETVEEAPVVDESQDPAANGEPHEPDIEAEAAELEAALDAPAETATPEPAADPEPDPQAPPEPTPPPDEPDPEAAAEPVKAARKPRTQAQKDKRKADDARRKTAIAEAHKDDTGPSEDDLAEQERKHELRVKMADCQGELEDLEAACDEMKQQLKALSAELYPHLTESDHHVDAVRGYIESQKKLRANRAGNPARIKAILAAAGKSPIDAAFSAQRARGMTRPTRRPATVAPTGGDAAPGAKPDATPGQE